MFSKYGPFLDFMDPPEEQSPMATMSDVENWFTYHKPTGNQQLRYTTLREEFKVLALLILDVTPCCPDQTSALRMLRETAMAVNQTIACNEFQTEAEESGVHS
jgi:hypothetical protein